jgi:hypothetical protein
MNIFYITLYTFLRSFLIGNITLEQNVSFTWNIYTIIP